MPPACLDSRDGSYYRSDSSVRIAEEAGEWEAGSCLGRGKEGGREGGLEAFAAGFHVEAEEVLEAEEEPEESGGDEGSIERIDSKSGESVSQKMPVLAGALGAAVLRPHPPLEYPPSAHSAPSPDTPRSTHITRQEPGDFAECTREEPDSADGNEDDDELRDHVFAEDGEADFGDGPGDESEGEGVDAKGFGIEEVERDATENGGKGGGLFGGEEGVED